MLQNFNIKIERKTFLKDLRFVYKKNASKLTIFFIKKKYFLTDHVQDVLNIQPNSGLQTTKLEPAEDLKESKYNEILNVSLLS